MCERESSSQKQKSPSISVSVDGGPWATAMASHTYVGMWSETDVVGDEGPFCLGTTPAWIGYGTGHILQFAKEKWNGPSRPILVPNRFIQSRHVCLQMPSPPHSVFFFSRKQNHNNTSKIYTACLTSMHKQETSINPVIYMNASLIRECCLD